ncbi:MAG: glycosyltransferase [Lachnospiraceae bacterium]|nr:glycosyltransferase [Lachnospiraceae bacterium]
MGMDKITVKDLYNRTVDFAYDKITIQDLDDYYHLYLEYELDYRRKDIPLLLDVFQDIMDVLEDTGYYYYFASFLIYASNDLILYKKVIRHCLNDTSISPKGRRHILGQLNKMIFLGVVSPDYEATDLLDDLYQMILDIYEALLSQEYHYIPCSDRNQNLVIILTGQVLSLSHGPTKTLMDRCYIIQKYMNKKVYIINTAEMVCQECEYPLFNQSYGNYMDELSNSDYILYKDCEFAYYQCPETMIDPPVLQEILNVVQSEKPFYILSIGGSSIVADLCKQIVPTVTIGTVPSNRTQTYGQFQTIGCRVNEDHLKWAEKHGLTKDHFIESLFTSSFKDQESALSREELGLPEEGFVVVLVGGRLNKEIDEDCLKLLLKLMEQDIYVAFMGYFERYNKLRDEYAVFRKYAIDLGFQADVLAALECCDLYINPRRVGGGTSVAEALYKGVPVVTMDHGDGGLGAGPNFHVKDYDDMYDTVLRYKSDPDFYHEMQKKAYERAEMLTDGKKEFIRVIEEAMSREDFQ